MKHIWIALLLVAALAVPYRSPAAGPAPAPTPTLPPYTSITPVRVLGMIRRVYRLRRPPPAYEIYTMDKKSWDNYDPNPDYAGTYTKKYWVRNLDRAALVRTIGRDDFEGDLTFDRPALNQDRDPGPPTADLFEPAHPQPVNFVPTPEPSASAESLKTIVSVVAYGEPDYNVTAMTVEGELLHLILQPKRDPERNVLREIWADKHTYVLKKIVAHDRMFIDGTNHIYPMRIDYTLGYLQGYVVVTRFDGTVLPAKDPDYSFEGDTGDSPHVEIDFRDISFPSSLPDWYFNPRQYAQNRNNAPE